MLKYPVYIGVGVNQETARKAIEAGTNLLVAGNYIFSRPSSVEDSIKSLFRDSN